MNFLIERGELTACPAIEEQVLGNIEGFRAARPRHTAMATDRLTTLLGKPPRDWREALRDHVAGSLISR